MQSISFKHRALFLALAAFAAGAAQALPGQLPSAQYALGEPALDKSYIAERPDTAKFIAEDGKRGGGPYRYGVVVKAAGLALRDGRANYGELTELADGRMLWRMAVVAPGAKSVDFAFGRLVLPEGAELFITDAKRETVRGPVTAAEVQADGRYFSPYVPGDTAVIEVAVPKANVRAVVVELTSVTHGYRGLFEQGAQEKSGSCNVDVACPLGNGWDEQIDSVGHYTFQQGGSSYVCTGSLVANSRRDTTPNFLTANHCVSTEATADSVVVYWNFQNATCRTPGSASSGTPISRSVSTHNQSGSQLLATSAASDFALLRLDAAVPTGADPFWSGWDNSAAAPTSAMTIHHPAGDEKRISIENQALSIANYYGAAGSGTSHLRVADWDEGTTEGGSSGAGLWNSAHRLVGQLHGGDAACGNNSPDWYGRLATSWTGGGTAASRLRDHLDPTNTGAATLDGNRSSVAPPPPPPSTVLQRGVAVTGLSGATNGELRFTMVIPADVGASNLSFSTSGGSGDADLYVKYGSAPTTAVYDCRSYGGTNAENCPLPSATAGTWHVLVRGYTAFSGLSLVGNYNTGSLNYFENANNYNINDNATVESPLTVSGRAGNAPATLRVGVDIKHTYIGDLKVDLVAPDGSVYPLHNRTGSGTDNILTTYTVNASSEVANGSWKLRVNDNASVDTGFIDKWSLTF